MHLEIENARIVCPCGELSINIGVGWGGGEGKGGGGEEREWCIAEKTMRKCPNQRLKQWKAAARDRKIQ